MVLGSMSPWGRGASSTPPRTGSLGRAVPRRSARPTFARWPSGTVSSSPSGSRARWPRRPMGSRGRAGHRASAPIRSTPSPTAAGSGSRVATTERSRTPRTGRPDGRSGPAASARPACSVRRTGPGSSSSEAEARRRPGRRMARPGRSSIRCRSAAPSRSSARPSAVASSCSLAPMASSRWAPTARTGSAPIWATRARC